MMKTQFVKQQIIMNYNKLSKLANVSATEKNVVPIWGVVYKKNFTTGSVNKIGMIERNNSAIRIVNGNEIHLQKRPLFATWHRTLKNINRMLQNIILNIENQDVVTKKVVNVFCFPQDTFKKIVKNTKHKKGL